RYLSYSRVAVYTAVCLALLGAGLVILARQQSALAWSLDRVTSVGFSAGVLTMVGTAALSYEFTSALRDDANRVNRSLEVLKELGDLDSYLREFTITTGRYIITRDERALAERPNLKASIDSSVSRLALLAPEPDQRARLVQIEQIHSRRIVLS